MLNAARWFMSSSSFRPGALAFSVSILLLSLCSLPLSGQEKRALTFVDLMQLREIAQPSISNDGLWIAFTAEPDRGDPEVIVRPTQGDVRYVIPFGSNPVISTGGDFVVVRINPSFEAQQTADRGDAPRRGMAILATSSGDVTEIEDVQSSSLSGDGRWLAYQKFAVDEEDAPTEEAPDEAPQPEGDREPGTLLVLRELASGREIEVPDVRGFAWHEEGRYLAYSIADADNTRDGLYVRDLGAPGEPESAVDSRPFGHYADITWTESSGNPALAFIMAIEDEDGEAGKGTVMAWNGSEALTIATSDDAPDGWFVPVANSLRWSDDGNRLFFGWRPIRDDERESLEGVAGPSDESQDEPFDPFDTEAILADRGVDVWHWLDPKINPQQKVQWNRERGRTYTVVHHMDSGRNVALGDMEVPDVGIPQNDLVAMAHSDVPYEWEATWTGGASDAYLVDLATGRRTQIAERLDGNATLSPTGSYAVFYADGDYHLYDVSTGTARNITEGLGVPIANEDHDFPRPAPGYGIGGWYEDDQAVLIHDKYDIWVIPTAGGAPWSLTDGRGRQEKRIFRIIDTDPDKVAIGPRDQLLLSSYHDLEKNDGFYHAVADRPGVTRLLEEEKGFSFLRKAEDADAVLFTRQAYDEFPDLWVARSDFSEARKLTDVNPNIEEFAWGTAELTEWLSADGIPLQGVVIKPGNYEPGKRYPVLVYYYRFMTDRLYAFNQPAVNHRPSFPLYASDGYVVFLPDVRFEVGRPGFSSTKSVVPGVQHLIDIGLADPNAICLHGHSWSGYQTAFMVTQTNIFKTAIAGAPVGNMTSAYSGIRLGSGLARQFQYEMTQSRLSGSLWDARDDYIDNSPVFFADKIQTPMLILHGDVDDAVPWEQSIELYLAMRRNGKEAVFLQYRDEPHHPQTYANKLDWATKMKEWVDHYLKGTPAPDWITKGIPYTGR